MFALVAHILKNCIIQRRLAWSLPKYDTQFVKSSIFFCNSFEGWDGKDGGKEVLERGDIGIPMADSC